MHGRFLKITNQLEMRIITETSSLSWTQLLSEMRCEMLLIFLILFLICLFSVLISLVFEDKKKTLETMVNRGRMAAGNVK